jgi:hypothetical protein
MTGDLTLVYSTPRIQPFADLLDSTIHLVGPSQHLRVPRARSLTRVRGFPAWTAHT